jgi:hypothetical protein
VVCASRALWSQLVFKEVQRGAAHEIVSRVRRRRPRVRLCAPAAIKLAAERVA